jgi:hypothetical protein
LPATNRQRLLWTLSQLLQRHLPPAEAADREGRDDDV